MPSVWTEDIVHEAKHVFIWVRVMVFDTTTFNNISVILWWSGLLMEETGVPGKNHWPKSLTNFIT
jgi:hypothetical protein